MQCKFLVVLISLFFVIGCVSLVYGQTIVRDSGEIDESEGIRLVYIDYDGEDYITNLYIDFDFKNYSKKEICWIVRFRVLPEDIRLNDVSFEYFKQKSDKSVIPIAGLIREVIRRIILKRTEVYPTSAEGEYSPIKTFDFGNLGSADVYRIADEEILSSFVRDYGMRNTPRVIERYLDEYITVFRVKAENVENGLALQIMSKDIGRILNIFSVTTTEKTEPDSTNMSETPDSVEDTINETMDDADAGESRDAAPREKRTFDDLGIKVKRETYWIDKKTNIVAIDPVELGGTVTAPLEISIESVGFEYTDYDSFVLVPDDGIPSMVLIFSKGSIKSTLYMDNDARALLDTRDSKIEIAGATSLKVDKSDIKKAENMELYVIDVRDNKGRTNLKKAMNSELRTGSKSIYPQISTGELRTRGSSVIIKEPKEIGFFDIRSISDLFLWLNLKFGMNLDNKEKKILQEGIYSTLQKAVEDSTATPPD